VSAHVGERLAAYLDGELSPRERAEVDTHLGGCPACTRELEDLASVDAAVRALPAEAPPDYFLRFPGRVRARLEAGQRRAAWRLPVWYAAAAAALIVAVIAPVALERSEMPPALLSEDAAPPPAVLSGGRSDASASPAPLTGSARGPEAPGKPIVSNRLESESFARARSAPARPAPESRHPTTVAGLHDAPAAEAPAPAEGALEGFAAAPAAPPPAAPGPVSAAAPLRRAEETPSPDAVAKAGRASLAESREEGERREEDERRQKEPLERTFAGAPGVAGGLALSGEEASYRALVARPARTRDEARDLREAWRDYLRLYPQGARADEARVRLIEAAHTAYRLGRDPEDRARFNEDAAAYLKRRDAAQPERVRQLERSVER